MRVLGFIGSLIATFLGLTAVTFSIGRFIPVDPVLAIVGDHARFDKMLPYSVRNGACYRR